MPKNPRKSGSVSNMIYPQNIANTKYRKSSGGSNELSEVWYDLTRHKLPDRLNSEAIAATMIAKLLSSGHPIAIKGIVSLNWLLTKR